MSPRNRVPVRPVSACRAGRGRLGPGQRDRQGPGEGRGGRGDRLAAGSGIDPLAARRAARPSRRSGAIGRRPSRPRWSLRQRLPRRILWQRSRRPRSVRGRSTRRPQRTRARDAGITQRRRTGPQRRRRRWRRRRRRWRRSRAGRGAEPNGGAGRNGGVGPSGGARPGRRGPGGEPSSGAGPMGGPGWPGAWPGIPSLGELPGLNGEALSDGATAELLKGRPKLSVSWRTLAGLSGEPGLLGRIGPVAATVARDLAAAAVADQTCEWRIIVVGARGQPLAVRRIRSPGRSGASSSGPPVRGPLSQVIVRAPTGCLSEVDASRHRFRSNGSAVSGSRAGGFAAGGSGAGESGSTGLPAALQRILAAAADASRADDTSARSTSMAMTQPGGTQPGGTQPGGTQPGGTHASGACAHARSGAGYRVPPRLRAFEEARDQDCGFPPCRRAAASCDMDHTIPYHLGGLTCECNLGPRCRRHHRMKGCGMWRLEQARSGVLRWTGPAGLTYMSAPEPLMA